MSDGENDPADPIARELFEAGRGERPRAEARARARAALGLDAEDTPRPRASPTCVVGFVAFASAVIAGVGLWLSKRPLPPADPRPVSNLVPDNADKDRADASVRPPFDP